jgi:hypothetical protein
MKPKIIQAVKSSQATRMPPTGGALNGGNQPTNIIQPAIRSDNTRTVSNRVLR